MEAYGFSAGDQPIWEQLTLWKELSSITLTAEYDPMIGCIELSWHFLDDSSPSPYSWGSHRYLVGHSTAENTNLQRKIGCLISLVIRRTLEREGWAQPPGGGRRSG